MLQSGLWAQAGQVVQGANLGSTFVAPAGDVDDDGFADYIVQLATTWEVRSGATGLALPALTRTRAAFGTSYVGLQADLDADGHDDLCFSDQVADVAEYRSGRDGSLLFAFTNANFLWAQGAADHDADGADDVMVHLDDLANSVRSEVVLSGQTGAVIATYAFPYTATNWAGANWVGDVDGDGFVDLMSSSFSFGAPFFSVRAGPDYVRLIRSGSGSVGRAFDTNGDGRDELLINGDLVDLSTSVVVWAGPMPSYLSQPALDLDGDGAADVADVGPILSGRTHVAFPGSPTGGIVQSLGDIDGDGRDESVISGNVFELVGGPAPSRVRDRGASGTTANQTRPRIRHRLRPRLGDSLLVDLNGAGGPNLVFLAIGTATDLDLAPVGAPGNRAYVQPIVAAAQVADAHGLARHALAVPNTSALLGQGASLQWAVFDPPANALGVATSNALDLVVGS